MKHVGVDVTMSESGLAYRRAGGGSLAVLLLHGIPGSSAAWEGVMRSLGDEVDVVAPDLVGFGASPRSSRVEDLHASGQAIALEALLDELGIASAVVVGHDFGVPTALALAGRRPDLVAGLGILAGNVFPDTPIPFPLSTATWPVVGLLTRRLLFSPPSLRMMLRQGVAPGSPPVDGASALGDAAQQRAIATIFANSLTRLGELYAPIERQLRCLEVPVFVGWGDRDPFFPVGEGRRIAETIGAELRVYEGAGHFLPHERPTDLAADIRTLSARMAS